MIRPNASGTTTTNPYIFPFLCYIINYVMLRHGHCPPHYAITNLYSTTFRPIPHLLIPIPECSMTHLYIRRRCLRSHSSLDLVHISLHRRFFTLLSPSPKDPSVLTRVALSETINTLQHRRLCSGGRSWRKTSSRSANHVEDVRIQNQVQKNRRACSVRYQFQKPHRKRWIS